MKTVLETLPTGTRGIVVTSENPEEAQYLETIYCGHGSIACFERFKDGNFALTLAETPEPIPERKESRYGTN